jgi:hypothetical protein
MDSIDFRNKLVKVYFHNGTVVSGFVEYWSDGKTILHAENGNLMIIHNTLQNVMMVHVTMTKTNVGADEIPKEREKELHNFVEKKMREQQEKVAVQPKEEESDMTTRLRRLATSRTQQIKNERNRIAQILHRNPPSVSPEKTKEEVMQEYNKKYELPNYAQLGSVHRPSKKNRRGPGTNSP